MGAVVLFAHLKMKVLAILLTIFTISFALQKSEPENCPQCREGVNTYFTHWSTGEDLHAGEQHVIQTVCPHFPDPEECETLVMTYWGTIAKIIFSERGAALMCNAIDPQCEVPSKREWDLDTCIDTTTSMLEKLLSDEVATGIVDLLKGERFCQDPDMLFTEEEITKCQDLVTEFIPHAMQALFFRSDARQLCCFHFEWEVPCFPGK